jgi:hypothetical protein
MGELSRAAIGVAFAPTRRRWLGLLRRPSSCVLNWPPQCLEPVVCARFNFHEDAGCQAVSRQDRGGLDAVSRDRRRCMYRGKACWNGINNAVGHVNVAMLMWLR